MYAARLLIVSLVLGSAATALNASSFAPPQKDLSDVSIAAQIEVDKRAPALWSSLRDAADALDEALADAASRKKRTLLRKDRKKLAATRDRLRSASKKDELSRDELSALLEDIENAQETIRTRRQLGSTAFQDSNQKLNQAYNMLSSIMESMNEMRMGAIRNML